MADGMKRGPATNLAWLGVPAWLLVCAAPLAAADIADPTRPPSGFSEHPREAPREAPMRVDSLFLMGKSSHATVDGRVVRVGDRLDAGRVDRIDESGVRLMTSAGPRQLKLLPAVEKTPTGKSKANKVEKR